MELKNNRRLQIMKNFHETINTNITLTEEAKFGIQYFGWDLDSIIEGLNEEYGTKKPIVITDADLYRVFYTVNNKQYEMDVDGGIEEL
jgi:hypothetical protein